MRGDKNWMKMLSMALWILVAFMTVSFVTTWFMQQSGFPASMNLQGYSNSYDLNASAYTSVDCQMTALTDLPAFAFCSLDKLTAPVYGLIDGIWGLLTNWSKMLHAIFASVPAGSLFEGIIVPFLTVIEIAAVIVLLMRLAAIVRGVAGGFL